MASTHVPTPMRFPHGRTPLDLLSAAKGLPWAALKLTADRVRFGLFILATGDLLFRPADLFPALDGVPIHMMLLVCCLALSIPEVMEKLSFRSLSHNAIAAFLLLLVPAVMLSHLSHGNTYDARIGAIEVAKACVFSFLVLALVTSPEKLRALLLAVAAAVFLTATLAVAQYHGLIHLAGLAEVEQRTLGPEGPTTLHRLCGIGVFNDPNDFSLVLVTGIVICVFIADERRKGLARWLLIVPLVLFIYALVLTHSRGGLLSGLAAFTALVAARSGWRNAALLILGALALVMLPFFGRQMNLNLADPDDSFQARLRLWSGSLDLFYSAPIFGIGQGRLVDEIGQVAHNSFLHAFTEMGLFGGTLFIGAFYLVLRAVWWARPVDREARRARPFILAIIVGYCAGLMSLSRCYTVPTQLVLAMVTAYLLVASRTGGAWLPQLNWPSVRRITGVGLAFLVLTYVFVGLMMLPGGT